MMLDRKQIWTIFLFKFKTSYKATETTHSINAFGLETVTSIQGSGGSRSFAKETTALNMRSAVASHQELTTTNWEDYQSWSSYKWMRSFWKTQCRSFYGHSALKQIGKVKKLNTWVTHEMIKKKNHRSKVSSSLILCNNKPFLNLVVPCDRK